MAANLGVRSVDVIVNGRTMGSACCVWKTPQKAYLLTAAHVLTSASGFVKWSGALKEGWGTVVPNSRWRPSRDPLTSTIGDLDAGLIEIDAPGPLGGEMDYPWAQPILSWNALNAVKNVVVVGKYNSAFARLVATAPAGKFRKLGHEYSRVLILDFASGTTQPGDSGAAVIALPEMALIGMHVGQSVSPAGEALSVAVAAEDVLVSYKNLLPGFDLRP